MRRVLAIAGLTFAEGVRMRVVLVLLVVLVFLVLRMPFALRGDETLTGRLQNFLAYSLGALSLLLGLATIFFSCATLTGEIRECSLHLVVTKPVSRFQILVGKWLGVNLLNLLVVILAGAAIYGFARFIKTRPGQFERDRLQVRDVVWTARIAASPEVPSKEIAERAAADVRSRAQSEGLTAAQQAAATAERIRELHNQWRTIENGGSRFYRFTGLPTPEREDTVIQVRYKARGIPLPPEELLLVGWRLYDPQSGVPIAEQLTEERSGYQHEFLFPAAMGIRDGQLLLEVFNPFRPRSEVAIFFEGDDSLQVLYKVSSFEANFVRALIIVLLQLGLLSALGVFFSVFVSFPVACLCTSVFYLLCLGRPFVLDAVGANLEPELVSPKYDPYGVLGPYVRLVLVPFVKYAFPDFTHYTGARYLVDGEYISLGVVARCLARTVIYGGALLLLPGWLIFNRREIAEVVV